MWFKEWLCGPRFYIWTHRGKVFITNNWPQDSGLIEAARKRNDCRISDGVAVPLELPRTWLIENRVSDRSMRFGVVESREITSEEWNSRRDWPSGYETGGTTNAR